MLEMHAKAKLNCSLNKLYSAIERLDIIYTLYCPDEHIVCKYLKGNPLKEKSVLYFEEYVAGKKHKLKYKVYKVTENKEVVLKAMFPRAMFNIKLIFNTNETDDGVEFSRTIRLGTKIPILDKIVDNFFYLIIGQDYYNEMILHNRDDFVMLKTYIENNSITESI